MWTIKTDRSDLSKILELHTKKTVFVFRCLYKHVNNKSGNYFWLQVSVYCMDDDWLHLQQSESLLFAMCERYHVSFVIIYSCCLPWKTNWISLKHHNTVSCEVQYVIFDDTLNKINYVPKKTRIKETTGANLDLNTQSNQLDISRILC